MSGDPLTCPGCESVLCEDCRGPLGRTCVIDTCARPPASRAATMCRMHQERSLRTGRPEIDSRRGAANENWTGDQVTYRALHKRLARARGKADQYTCVDCGRPAQQWAYDNTDPNPRESMQNGSLVQFSNDLNRYQPMCRRCHKNHDNNDRVSSGRPWNKQTARGTANARAKLSPDQVREIRRRAQESPRVNVSALSREFGVARGSIDRVIAGLSYQDVDSPKSVSPPAALIPAQEGAHPDAHPHLEPRSPAPVPRRGGDLFRRGLVLPRCQ